MKIISILNHKGGVGKSTIATNLAGYYANKGGNVLLGDFDVQQSSQNWLNFRPENAAPIKTWELEDGKLVTPPDDTTHIVIDSPAGIRSNSLERLVSMSDKIITPLKPSLLDMMSTEQFFEEVVTMINNQEKQIDLCVVGNMVDFRTKSAEQLRKFLDDIGIECPTFIRQGQIYIHLVAHGLSIFDSKSDTFKREIEQWQPLIDWLEK